MVKIIMEILKKNNLKITFAESCTGGAICARFVEEAGASNYLEEAYVTYAIKSKINLIGVKKETIDTFGVVSENVAYEMCVGAAKRANADVCISVTGIAGPSDDMGLVCLGFYIKGKTATKTLHISSKNRVEVIDKAVCEAYLTLNELLCNLS